MNPNPETVQLIVQLIVMPAVAAVILTLLWWSKVFTGGAFDAAPRREGKLQLFDPLIALGLLMIGQSMAMALFMTQTHEPAAADSAQSMLYRLLATQIGALPMIVYIFYRAQTEMVGELAAFGFALRRIGAALRYSVIAFIAVFPLTMAVSMLVVFVMQQLGFAPDMLAHETLKVMVNEPWGPAKWGLIVTAVIGAPIVEEILFRGFIQTALLHSNIIHRRWTAIVVAAVLFTLIHIDIAQPQALPALYVLALGLGYVYERTGSLFAPMLLHGMFNAVQITIALSSLVQTHTG